MKVELAPVPLWRHDLAGCLHSAIASVLMFRGLDAFEWLGASWGFEHVPGKVGREEYYFPPWRPSLLESLAPYHPIRSRWHEPSDAAQGWEQVRSRVVEGTPVIVAVDNFHLPFRPAYGDVHTNHLVVVRGFDDEAGTVVVLDAVPPRFDGVIPLDVLQRARASVNPARGDRDMFFTDNPIRNRWLEIEITQPAPEPGRSFVAKVIERNAERWRAPATKTLLRGVAGLARFLDESAQAAEKGDPVVDELFVVAGAALAATALHAGFLGKAAQDLNDPSLAEIARRVDRIAHHWTAARITIALARSDRAMAGRLHHRFRSLVGEVQSVLPDLEATAARLAG